MSWRDVMGGSQPLPLRTQLTQHTQPDQTISSVRSVSSVRGSEKKSADDEGRLLEALAAAAEGMPVTSADLYEALAPEDITAWRNGSLGADNLRAFAVALYEGREREAGRIPDSYEDIVTCGQCGPVWLFTSGDVPSCPWCINRIAGLPIPRPAPVTCGTCRHFQRNKHPHLGRCGVGMKAHAPAGNWDTDRHDCKRWLPE
ncbi:hypothetical protein ACS8YF_12615 [Salinisphaera sp. SWV1]|uniref:hypothetical protein n=1 Tax=Salinisphaera sp. SWV1 TaxID=3454139 RepID=UPI003F853A36